MPQQPAPRNIAINGRFLTQKLSGVQRYCREIVTALDKLIVADRAGGGVLAEHCWRLIAPQGADTNLALQAIAIETVGTRRGHAWEQFDLARAARGARLVSLGNSGPLLHSDSLVVIHDAAVFRTPQNFRRSYRLAHQLLGRAIAHRSRLGTVSRFSQGELAAVLGVPREEIFIAHNGCDHLLHCARDTHVREKVGLGQDRYFLVVGTAAPNKNIAMALAAFAQLERDDVKLVIAGQFDPRVFGGAIPTLSDRVIVARGRSDAEIAALFAEAVALVFPSRYEGFGIPPLEAMANRCPVIACDIPVTREVCADAAFYVPLDDVAALALAMREHLDNPDNARSRIDAGLARVRKFSWAAAARQLADAIVGKHE